MIKVINPTSGIIKFDIDNINGKTGSDIFIKNGSNHIEVSLEILFKNHKNIYIGEEEATVEPAIWFPLYISNGFEKDMPKDDDPVQLLIAPFDYSGEKNDVFSKSFHLDYNFNYKSDFKTGIIIISALQPIHTNSINSVIPHVQANFPIIGDFNE